VGHFWNGKPRLHIRYKVGDLIKQVGHYKYDPDWYGVVTKIDPWFMGKKAGIQSETYSIEVMWHFNKEMGRHDISIGNDPFEIVSEAKNDGKHVSSG